MMQADATDMFDRRENGRASRCRHVSIISRRLSPPADVICVSHSAHGGDALAAAPAAVVR
jgi:hypothetical protein